MPKFRYLAVDHAGRLKRGTIEAPDFRSAAEELRSGGLWIMKLFDQGKSVLYRDLPALAAPRVKSEHFTVFCRQLATLYKAGVGLLEALRVMAEQTASKPLRKVLREMGDDMLNGHQLSEAAAKFPSVFSNVFVNMVRAGETSGKLDEMLERLAVFYEKEHYTKVKVRSAMIYPAVIGALTIVVTMLMMIVIVPRYVAAFQDMGIELPLPTRILIVLSHAMQQTWFLLPFLFIMPVLLRRLIRGLPNGRYMLDYAKLRIPVLGPLRRKQTIARFSRTFSSLYAAAIPVMQILSIVAAVVGNEAMKRVVLDARERARSGQTLADAFRDSRHFPPMVAHMISIGEKTGAIDTMLDKVADFCESDADQMADRLKSLLEPFMILVMSLVVGGIVAAMLLPVFRILSATNNMG
jgi:type IV pilus assembly protein PilC